jgi:hypothetical protein
MTCVGPRHALRALVPLVVLGLPLACTFERRPAVEGEAGSTGELVRSGGISDGLDEGAALETVRLFREAVALGDLSLALVLLDREATLVDELVGEASEARTRGELLLALRRRHAAGLSFESRGDPLVASSGEGLLVGSHLTVFQAEAGGDPALFGTLYESVLLVPGPGAWRIRHLHRSFVPEPAMP